MRIISHPTFRQFVRFSIVGVAGFVVDFVILTVGIELIHLNRYSAAFFSFPFAVTATWLGNRLFTFRGGSSHTLHEEFLRFITVCAVGVLINRSTYSAIITLSTTAYDHPVLGLMAGTMAGLFFNFFLSKKLVFR